MKNHMPRIEISGNIASGKTTLCNTLTIKQLETVFEDYHNNPFLSEFYRDPNFFAFETEITFLLQHYHLIKKQKHAPIICDYSFLLDLAYADMNLTGNRHRIFCEIITELQNEVFFPSRIINIICPEEILLQRIKSRNREVETSITINYLRSLNRAILLRINSVSNKIPITTIDSNLIDFRFSIEGIQELDLV